jgi:hypothetical protein
MTKRKMIERPPGRPPVSEDEGPSAVLRARVGAERVALVKRLGGAEWLRKTIDKAAKKLKAIDRAKEPKHDKEN